MLVDQTIHTVETNLMEGGSFVVIILLLTLGNLKAFFIVAAAIPISMMFSFMGMKAMGITANIMSLAAIDFGMIVDGSIVMVENSLRKLAAANRSPIHSKLRDYPRISARNGRPSFWSVDRHRCLHADSRS